MKWLVVGVFLGVLGVVKGRDPDDGRIIAARSTKTAIVLTTSTTTTPFTCAFATNGVVCQRRRYKRYSAIDDKMVEDGDTLLDGSLDPEGAEGQGAGSNREARIALTVWTTTSSTFTVTATSTNSATTFSLSFYCTVNGASYPPACG